MNWFRRKKAKPQVAPTVPVDYPTGTCVQTENGLFYIKGKFRYRITSMRILDSWDFPYILKSSESALARCKIGGKLGFRQGTLVKDISSDRMYLISENLRRQITSPDFFDIMLFPRDNMIEVSPEELALHKEGEKITWQLPPTSLQAGQ
ncbi:hypothetical protein SEA_WOFFORD_67 [Streptomyces phage Wofford]|uniref:Uncharacterized protein n=1 Tax=Streptomyces phage Wofford TaxID=2283267 RepID=A0A345MA99_9CAUD|nr:hypothetical protein HWB78_gp207 [Streptomyces phage Wollford]AXH67420.1 hypothetical protein SEA_WOFFORD_67 [Streptomyces phage Wollford]